MKKFLISVFLLALTTGLSHAQWTEGFESYTAKTWPSTWTATANATKTSLNYVDNTISQTGSNSLRMCGTVNGCWAAFAAHSLDVNPPFDIEIKIRNNNEQLSGCHPKRANIFLREGTDYQNAGREILLFDKYGTIYSHETGLNLMSYSTLTWYTVKIRYEKSSDTTVKLSYWINGEYIGEETRSAISEESKLTYLQLGVQEGTAWFDDISVTGTTGGTNVIFDDGFESDALGSQPAGWALKYNGTGSSNQIVISNPVKNGAHAFQMEGKYNWASEFYKVPEEIPGQVTLEAWVNCEKTLSGLAGSIGLGNFTLGTWGTRTSRLQFYGGRLQATYADNSQGPVFDIMDYTPGQWYHIKMEHNLPARTYKVYIDGTQVSSTKGAETISEFPMHPTTETIHVMLAAGNSGTTKMFFDDVKLYATGQGTGVYDVYKPTVKVYPNPTQGAIQIISEQGQYGINGIKLISLAGRAVKQFSSTQIEGFDISDVAPGTYILILTTADGQIISQKVRKQ